MFAIHICLEYVLIWGMYTAAAGLQVGACALHSWAIFHPVFFPFSDIGRKWPHFARSQVLREKDRLPGHLFSTILVTISLRNHLLLFPFFRWIQLFHLANIALVLILNISHRKEKRPSALLAELLGLQSSLSCSKFPQVLLFEMSWTAT